MQPDNEVPSALQLKANLTKALLAQGKGREAFNAAFDEMFPEKKPRSTPAAPSAQPSAPRHRLKPGSSLRADGT